MNSRQLLQRWRNGPWRNNRAITIAATMINSNSIVASVHDAVRADTRTVDRGDSGVGLNEPVRLLVALCPARDLLNFAKDLFVAAIVSRMRKSHRRQRLALAASR
jgi:hypothetical protein